MAFSNQLVEAQFRAKAIWEATKNDPSKMPRINALAAIQAETTARIDETYSDPEKKRTNRLFWINHRCGAGVTDGRPGCDLDFSPLTAADKAYTLTRSKTDGFSASYREFETSVFDRQEVIAEGIPETEKRLFEDFNTRVHSFINDPANLTNYAMTGIVTDPSDNTIVIAPERWTPRVLGIASRVAAQAGMKDPFIISGNALYDIMWDTKKDMGMEVNIGNAARLRDHRIYVDFTMDGTIGEEKFFLVDRGVLAILNRLDWRNTTPISLDGAGRLSWGYNATVLNTPIGVGIDGKPVTLKIDRSTQRDCVNGTDFKDQHGFNLNADIVRMPDADCTDDAEINGGTFTGKYTGIFAFKCGNPADFASGSGA